LALVLVSLLILTAVPSRLAFAPSVAADDPATGSGYAFEQRFQEYYTYPVLSQELMELEANHSDIMRLYDLTANTDMGKTWDDRTVYGVKISDNPEVNESGESKTLIVGNVHAREWMGCEVVMYFLHYLLESYGQPPTDNDNDSLVNEDPIDGVDNDGDGLVDEDGIEAKATWLVNNREIWIIPMPNPDGQTYDQKLYDSGDGSWRKNMRDNDGNGQFDPNRDGVDLNRNFPYEWGGSVTTDGISSDTSIPSSGVYRGPEDNFDDDGDSKFPAPDYWRQRYSQDWNGIDEDPVDGMDNDGDGKLDEDKHGGFSEPETQAIRSLVKTYDDQMGTGSLAFDTSITYHSYSELVLYPWGYTPDHAPDYELLVEMATVMANYTGYQAIQGPDLYPTTGDSDDWLYGSGGILAFTIELNSADDGGAEGDGFHPPVDVIIPTCRLLLSSNLYLVEIAPQAHAAKELGSPTANIELPEFEFVGNRSQVNSNEDYEVKVKVARPDTMRRDTLVVRYSTDGKEWGSEPMKERASGVFAATLPRQQPNTTVQYYVEVETIYGFKISAPVYGDAEPMSYFVDYDIGTSSGSLAVMSFMMLAVCGTLWGGFGKALQRAMKAEKQRECRDMERAEAA